MSPPGHSTTVLPRPSTWSPVNTARSAASSKQQWSAACPGVGSGRSSSPPAATGDPAARSGAPAVLQPSAMAASGAPTRPANARAPSAWSTWVWVSSTSSTSRPAQAPTTAWACASSSGPGSITTTAAAPGSATTKVLVPSSVSGDGFGASTLATRSLQRSLTPPPPAPGTAPPTA
jgi:hypothetical protein